MNPFDLDWGIATIEFYSANQNVAIHVLEHDLKSPAGRARAIRFIGGRARWFARILPSDCRQQIIYDQRTHEADEQAVSNHLLLESPRQIEWFTLCCEISYLRYSSEFFPVPSEEPWEHDALAVCVPHKHVADPFCLAEMISNIKHLQSEYEMEVFDMRSSRKINVEAIRLMQAAPLDIDQSFSSAGIQGGPMSFNVKYNV